MKFPPSQGEDEYPAEVAPPHHQSQAERSKNQQLIQKLWAEMSEDDRGKLVKQHTRELPEFAVSSGGGEPAGSASPSFFEGDAGNADQCPDYVVMGERASSVI